MPETPLFAVCEDCGSIIPGVLSWRKVEGGYIYIDFESELGRRVKEHHSDMPSGFGHNFYWLFLRQVEAETSSGYHVRDGNIGFLVVSRASLPHGEIDLPN